MVESAKCTFFEKELNIFELLKLPADEQFAKKKVSEISSGFFQSLSLISILHCSV